MFEDHFLKMIQRLRWHEEVLLYHTSVQPYGSENQSVIDLLKAEYETEALNHPFQVPAFDGQAALWAAEVVYAAAQLTLYRKQAEEEIDRILPSYEGPMTVAAILSADLCLRFIPDILTRLELISPDDTLIGILTRVMARWHYSGVDYKLVPDQLDFSLVQSDQCFAQIYANRIVRYKKLALATHPVFQSIISGNLGNFAKEYWTEFHYTIMTNEPY